jgi:hypothetical protein
MKLKTGYISRFSYFCIVRITPIYKWGFTDLLFEKHP